MQIIRCQIISLYYIVAQGFKLKLLRGPNQEW